MRDVALRAGVSTATVSNVLAGRKQVDAELARRVRRAAADLDYQIDRAASQLRGGKARVLGVVVPSLENTFFNALIAAIERQVRSEGYDIIVASANEDEAIERTRLAALLSWRPAGMLVIPCDDAFATRDQLDFSGVPYVVVDRVATELSTDAVTIDNERAGAAAAEHLVQLGHREILVVASSLALANIRERCDGIRQACAAARIESPEVLEVGRTFEEVTERLESRLIGQDRPTAIIALTNFATLGVLATCSQLAIGVPDDVSLVGFDDYTWMSVSTPSITAIRQPVHRMATAAWECLRTRIAGEERPPSRLKFSCDIKIRRSTRAVGRADTAGAIKKPTTIENPKGGKQ